MQGTAGGRLEPPPSLHNAGYSSSKSSISLLNANKHLMTGPERDLSFCFPRITSVSQTLRFEGNKINCFQKDQSLSDLLYI